MNNYKIAKKVLAFNYHYDDYFKNNIEKYRISNDVSIDVTIDIQLCDAIDVSNKVPYLVQGNRKYYEYDHYKQLDVYTKDNKISTSIVHTEDYSHTTLKLAKSLNTKLPEQEYVLSGLVFMEYCIRQGIIPIHASAVLYQGEVILFSAPSQTGKSTHASLWETFIEGAKIMNDDKPLIITENHRFMITSAPFSGKRTINDNHVYPLKAIVFISQGNPMIHKLDLKDSLNFLLKNTLRPSDTSSWQNISSTLDQLIRTIPFYHLQADISKDSVYTVIDTVYKKNKTP